MELDVKKKKPGNDPTEKLNPDTDPTLWKTGSQYKLFFNMIQIRQKRPDPDPQPSDWKYLYCMIVELPGYSSSN